MALGSRDALYQRISRAIKRGKLYDEDIPEYVETTVRELEDEHDFKHMWVEKQGNLTVGVNTLAFTGVFFKNVRFVNVVAINNDEHPLRKTKRENVTNISSGRPGAFWMQNDTTVGLDALPDEAYFFSTGYYAYSVVPLEDSLAWLRIGEDVLMAKTLVNMHGLIRDDNILKRWGRTLDRRMPGLLQAQVDSEEDGVENKAVPFATELEEDNVNLADFM